MPGMPGYEQANAQLTGLTQKKTDLQRAVASGDLWMEAGVAKAASDRCLQAVDEIDHWLSDAEVLLERLPFGANQDGNQAANRYHKAAVDFRKAMHDAQGVLRSMAATYRAAGRTITEADVTSAQPFQGRPE